MIQIGLLYALTLFIYFFYRSQWTIQSVPKSFAIFWLEIELTSMIVWFGFMFITVKTNAF